MALPKYAVLSASRIICRDECWLIALYGVQRYVMQYTAKRYSGYMLKWIC